jgi:hypothetical protein
LPILDCRLAGESELTRAGWRPLTRPRRLTDTLSPNGTRKWVGGLGAENFLLAILRVLLYQILALLGERELSEQYGQQGET